MNNFTPGLLEAKVCQTGQVLAVLPEEPHLAAQAVRIVVRLPVNDEHFAVGGAILQHRNERAIKLGGAAGARDHDRKPRHVTFLVELGNKPIRPC